MRVVRQLAIAGGAIFLASCAAQAPPAATPAAPKELPGLLTRDLSAAEKAALTHALARTLKDPDSAKFQWGQVKYLPGSNATEYCGLINAKNSYGGYNGFQMFYASLMADPKGQYTAGRLDTIIANNPVGSEQLSDNVRAEDRCIVAGYGHLSTVPQ